MSGSIGVSPLQTYLTDAKNEVKLATAAAAANPQQTGLINYFQAHAASITTPAALLGNYKALSVVLGAFGLGSLVSSTALVKQLLTQNPADKSSVAYRIGNAKYLAFAKALSNWNPPPFGTQSGISAIISAYKTNNFETQADQQTPGLRQALYFTRIAPSITTLTQLQSDPDLVAVAVSGTGLPLTAFDNLSFDQQTALLKQKINLGSLKTPSYVQHITEQFLVQQQLNNGFTAPQVQPGSVASLFGGASSGNTGGDGLLTILQTAEGGSGSTTTSLLGTQSTSNNPLLSLFA